MNKIYLRIIAIGLFFFYQFGLNNILMVLGVPICETFTLNASDLGILASLYFWGDIVFLLPAGWLVDHFGARRVVLTVMAVSIVLVFLSAIWANLYVFAGTRFLEGVCGGFGLIGALKLGTFYVNKDKFALMTGIVTTLGMLGSFMMSMPLSVLIESTSWRFALLVIGVIGVIILALLVWATHEKPTQVFEQKRSVPLKKILEVLIGPQTVLNGVYVCFITLPIYLLAALWGAPMLMAIMHISASMSALIVSMLFVGNMLGAPLFGFLSDYYKKRKLYMYLGAGLSFIILLFIMFGGLQHVFLAFLLFLLLGLATSTQALAFAVAMEQNPHQLSGSVNSSLAIISALGGAIGQPVFGLLLFWLENLGVSSGDAYLKLCYLFLGAFVIAFISAWKIKSQ